MRGYAALLVMLSPLGLMAQTSEARRPPFVRASGEATVTAKPDRAQVTIGVASRASTASAAATQNAEDSTKLMAAIKQALGNGGDVKTSGYSLSPQYEYPQNHVPKLSGYEDSNTVTVTVDDLPRVGKVIDAATSTGATNINGISFLLKDDTAVRKQALVEAAKQARANGEALAGALGLEVVGVLEAEPTEVPIVRPKTMALMTARAAAPSAPTPVEAGELDIRASVTVVLQER